MSNIRNSFLILPVYFFMIYNNLNLIYIQFILLHSVEFPSRCFFILFVHNHQFSGNKFLFCLGCNFSRKFCTVWECQSIRLALKTCRRIWLSIKQSESTADIWKPPLLYLNKKDIINQASISSIICKRSRSNNVNKEHAQCMHVFQLVVILIAVASFF